MSDIDDIRAKLSAIHDRAKAGDHDGVMFTLGVVLLTLDMDRDGKRATELMVTQVERAKAAAKRFADAASLLREALDALTEKTVQRACPRCGWSAVQTSCDGPEAPVKARCSHGHTWDLVVKHPCEAFVAQAHCLNNEEALCATCRLHIDLHEEWAYEGAGKKRRPVRLGPAEKRVLAQLGALDPKARLTPDVSSW
jgi:hypothetical protein